MTRISNNDGNNEEKQDVIELKCRVWPENAARTEQFDFSLHCGNCAVCRYSVFKRLIDTAGLRLQPAQVLGQASAWRLRTSAASPGASAWRLQELTLGLNPKKDIDSVWKSTKGFNALKNSGPFQAVMSNFFMWNVFHVKMNFFDGID